MFSLSSWIPGPEMSFGSNTTFARESDVEVEVSKQGTHSVHSTLVSVDSDYTSVPADVLKVVKGLEVAQEAEMLDRAEAWCGENEPASLGDISINDEIIDEFVKSLGLAAIPEKRLRRVLHRHQVLRSGQLAPASEMPSELVEAKDAAVKATTAPALVTPLTRDVLP